MNIDVYCTLFDSNYLDKGMITINSLLDVCKEAEIYVLAMDEKCADVLNTEYGGRITVISLDEFVNDRLAKVKAERKWKEFCWTCTASLILYVLKNYNKDICTYIDADMYFYDSPNVLVREMIDAGACVQIMEHRIKNGLIGRKLLKDYGTFCVEFNTFKKEEKSIELLEKWIDQTIACCGDEVNRKVFGDQYYLNEWTDYDFVHINRNMGAGVAPWNVNRYETININSDKYLLKYDKKQDVNMIFYHFHGIDCREDGFEINVYKNFWKVDESLVREIYQSYLGKTLNIKEYITDKYSLTPTYSRGIADYTLKKESVYEKLKRQINNGYFKSFLANFELTLKHKKNEKKDIIYSKQINRKAENSNERL